MIGALLGPGEVMALMIVGLAIITIVVLWGWRK
jgi:hypothetical protein